VGPGNGKTHEDRQHMKGQRTWISPDGGRWDDQSLAEDLNEQTCAGPPPRAPCPPSCGRADRKAPKGNMPVTLGALPIPVVSR